jgi:hypothetical protein
MKLHLRVRTLIRNKRVHERDRSKCVYEIVTDLFYAGASFNEIATILERNVYFVAKYGTSDAALAREISRITNKLESRK